MSPRKPGRKPKKAAKNPEKTTSNSVSVSLSPQAAKATGLDESFENLVSANLTALTNTTASLSMTVDTIVTKMENMAYYIIAMEAILTELVAEHGIDLTKVNALIRSKISSAGADNAGDATKALNIAANICIFAKKRN